jgi:hypothetical protein
MARKQGGFGMKVDYTYSTSSITINQETFKLDLGKVDSYSDQAELKYYMHEALHPFVWGMIRDFTGNTSI